MQNDKEGLKLHHYSLPDFDINSLNEVFIQIRSAESFHPGERSFINIQPEEISNNSALFLIPSVYSAPFVVSVQLQNKHLFLSCSCNASHIKLCSHEAQALYNIFKRNELRFFFDPLEHNTQLKKHAAIYGLENETDLDSYFEVSYQNGKLQFKSLQKGLITIDGDNLSKFKDIFSDEPKSRHSISPLTSGPSLLLVLKQHKYYRQLNLQLALASHTQKGGLKNPVKEVKAIDYIWQTEQPAESKFFSAVQLFENSQTNEVSSSLLNGLKAIVKNPLNIGFHFHDAGISENLTSASLSSIQLGLAIDDLKISVLRDGNFYNITARAIINDSPVPLSDLKLVFDYFLEFNGQLHLLGSIKLIKLVQLFRQNDFRLTVHESKYEQFRTEFLLKLEDAVTVNYSYLQEATPKQLQENHFDEAPEKIIYITDSDPYVDIEPVMKYGNQEIAILSKRQIYSQGIKGDSFAVKRDSEAELKFIALISVQHALFAEQLEDGLSYFYLHKDRFLDEDWFLKAFDLWQRLGIQVYGFNKLRNNRLNQHKASISVQIQSGQNWFNVDLEVKYGSKRASLKKLKKAAKNRSKYVELDDGTLGILPAEWIDKFSTYFEAGEIIDDHFKIPKTNFSFIKERFEHEIIPQDVMQELDFLHSSFADFESIREVEPPVMLQGKLRDYQQQGLNWLNFLDDYNFGACLADDMGLGKTVQVLAFILLQKQKRGNSVNLLIVPTSLIFNWQQEIEKFAPSLNLLILHGGNRVYNPDSLNGYDIVISTYGTLLSDINYLKKYTFNYVILDESQNIKNPESQRYKAVRLLNSRNRIVLTGTPFENNTFDLYAQLSFACPGLLGSKHYFRDVYSTPIDKFKDSKRAIELQNLIKPFILRRTKKQVAPELPDKTEMVLYCEMQPEQRKVYENYEQEMRDYLSGINNDDISKSAIHVLRGLTRLRQICDSPLLLREPTLDHIGSAKIDALMEQISSKSSHHKILVFSQFVTMLDLIKTELNKLNIKHTYLTGSTKDRQKVVNEFQENNDIKVFLISLKAGGTGLNLTKADYVYLIDPWWNPSVENQAIDRIYRIGQKKNVVAVRMICPNTVEEKIQMLQQSKNELADNLIGSETDFFKSLSKEDLLALLSPTLALSLR